MLELAKHPEIQSRLRVEIRETEAAIHARGDVDFAVADFDAMPYTTAVMKVRDTFKTLWSTMTLAVIAGGSEILLCCVS